MRPAVMQKMGLKSPTQPASSSPWYRTGAKTMREAKACVRRCFTVGEIHWPLHALTLGSG